MAEKYNMKLLFTVPFADYFQQKIHNSENRGLIGRMQGLEVWPVLYTVGHKNEPLYFVDIFANYWPIFQIFSLAHTADNLQ